MPLRVKLWNKLVNEWNVCDKLPAIANEVELEELKDTYIDAILAGKTRGRVVVKMKENCCDTKPKHIAMNGHAKPETERSGIVVTP
jgi:hypothetical protein